MAEETKSSNKKLIIIIVILLILLIGGGVTVFVMMNNKSDAGTSVGEGTSDKKIIPNEVNAGVLSPDKLKEWNEAELAALEDNQVPIVFSPIVNSVDGENFSCEIGNPPGAKYDIYLDMYSDTTLEEEVYLSGLIPAGQGIQTFKTNRKFPKGETDIVLVITTVKDDKATLVAQTMVVLTLNVE